MANNINTDRIYNFDVQCHAEIRKCELIEQEFTGKDDKIIRSRYLELTCEDDDLNRFFVKDKLIDNQSLYHRGMVGTFILQIHVEEKYRGRTMINLKRFIPDEK